MNRKIKFRFYDKALSKMVYRNLLPYDNEHEDIAVMQYTGLKDTKGKDIYEGDILKSLGTDICVVIYIDKLACFMLENTNPTKDYDNILSELHLGYRYREVIGNIYENGVKHYPNGLPNFVVRA